MIYPEDLKDLTIYKKEMLPPVIEENKRKGSVITLLTPNIESSINMMNLPYMKDRHKSYESYYMEKNSIKYINNESVADSEDTNDEYLHEISEDEIKEWSSL